jgi:hypothetical protein
LSKNFGLVSLDNCKFKGTGSQASAFNYRTLPKIHKLSVTNCTFDDQLMAINIPNINDVEIKSNTFKSCKTGIKSSFANQSFAEGDISNNTFTNGLIDIHSTGAWKVLDIQRNNLAFLQMEIICIILRKIHSTTPMLGAYCIAMEIIQTYTIKINSIPL